MMTVSACLGWDTTELRPVRIFPTHSHWQHSRFPFFSIDSWRDAARVGFEWRRTNFKGRMDGKHQLKNTASRSSRHRDSMLRVYVNWWFCTINIVFTEFAGRWAQSESILSAYTMYLDRFVCTMCGCRWVLVEFRIFFLAKLCVIGCLSFFLLSLVCLHVCFLDWCM